MFLNFKLGCEIENTTLVNFGEGCFMSVSCSTLSRKSSSSPSCIRLRKKWHTIQWSKPSCMAYTQDKCVSSYLSQTFMLNRSNLHSEVCCTAVFTVRSFVGCFPSATLQWESHPMYSNDLSHCWFQRSMVWNTLKLNEIHMFFVRSHSQVVTRASRDTSTLAKLRSSRPLRSSKMPSTSLPCMLALVLGVRSFELRDCHYPTPARSRHRQLATQKVLLWKYLWVIWFCLEVVLLTRCCTVLCFCISLTSKKSSLRSAKRRHRDRAHL